ncbi:MAG: tRNA 2-selenouridine(34) synthase MnmH [Alphaproteobacteria bacterium]|nr:tRNA 2-selenouridine(34) synthase MnmH [Alphaproteobacteria bacterium]MDX5369906.1 tRNA 2-selenouridine(34) synthase MnmH [Alphaproteobacteria bacterium]MDX5464502.1 tRNA 2-selenouridine(34) synthase MnmH [Alphaproteobacteria bacterium]
MTRAPTVTDDLDTSPYDEVIDVRSPSEYAEDHIPGAISLPVLSDAERARVGTIYKQESPFTARKLGAAIISRNIAAHIESHFAEKDGGYRPLVYCWRGGQRSGSMATILAAIGWRVSVLDGGYRRYRRHVTKRLYEDRPGWRFRVIGGLTGTAKTRLLHALADAGEPVLDLEGLANHKGSLLGRHPTEPQPAQKMFESGILAALDAAEPGRTIWVESESSKVGNLTVPPAVWAAMQAAPVVEIAAPLAARVAHILDDYAYFLDMPDRVAETLAPLTAMHGHETLDRWRALIAARQWPALVEALLVEHYDPAYRRSLRREGRTFAGRIDLPDLSPETLAALAARLRDSVREPA